MKFDFVGVPASLPGVGTTALRSPSRSSFRPLRNGDGISAAKGRKERMVIAKGSLIFYLNLASVQVNTFFQAIAKLS
jgi:hypothetical protein